MSFHLLTDILSPPSEPVDSKTVNDWSSIHSQIGLTLPLDYINFINKYGSGQIGEWLTIFNPFSSDEHLSLIPQVVQNLSSFNQIKSEFPEEIPYPLLFEPGGLLPWGVSIDGDVFNWLTKGVNGNWSIVIIGRQSEPEEFQLSFSKFLVECIQNTISPNAIPVEWVNEEVKFIAN